MAIDRDDTAERSARLDLLIEESREQTEATQEAADVVKKDARAAVERSRNTRQIIHERRNADRRSSE